MALASGSVTIKVTLDSGEVINIGETTSDTTSVFAETKDLDLGDPSTYKHLRRIFLYMSGPNPNIDSKMRVQIKARNNFNTPLKTIADIRLVDAVKRWRRDGVSGTVGVGGQYEDVDQDYREIPLKLRLKGYKTVRLAFIDEAVNSNWAIFGFSIWGFARGKRF